MYQLSMRESDALESELCVTEYLSHTIPRTLSEAPLEINIFLKGSEVPNFWHNDARTVCHKLTRKKV